ncbi:MAG: glycosyltransferase family 39 protein [Chloroflexota bacterium]
MSRVRIAAVLVFIISLTIAVLVLTDAVPELRGPAPSTGVWHWPYMLRPVVRWLPAVVVSIALLVVGVWWVANRPHLFWPVLVVAGLSLGLQLGILYADQPNIGAALVDRTLSKDTNGYAAAAGEIDDLGGVLRTYPAFMAASDNEHVRTHPPGLVTGYWLADRMLEATPRLTGRLAAPVRLWRCTDLWVLSRPLSAAAGLLTGSLWLVVSAALTPVAAYFVARRLFRGAAIALAAVLAAIIPALLVFSPTPDQLYAFLSLISLWFLLKGVSGSQWGWLAGAGITLSAMTFMSIGNVAWAGLLGAFLIISAWRQGWSTRQWAAGLGAFGLGMVSLWLIYWLGWGVSPWAVIETGLQQHYQLVTSQRDYWTWVGYNPLDFLLFTGVAIVVGWGGLTAAAVVRRGWRRSEAGLLAILLATFLLALMLSGSTRGEVGRLWLVFMPLSAVLAGGGWSAAAGQDHSVHLPVWGRPLSNSIGRMLR